MTAAADVETRAAEWIARRDREVWTEWDQNELDVWLAESTAHRIAYLRLEGAWRSADRLSALRVPAVPMRAPVANPSPHRMLARVAAGLLVAALFGGTLLWFGQSNAPRTFQTAIGEHRPIELADGSHLELNTDTLLHADITSTRRVVWLDRGEAYFSVAHDTQHPFVIHSGARAVTVLGTRFSVRSDADHFDVEVESGRVGVVVGNGHPDVLSPGDILDVNGATATKRHLSKAELAQRMSWRSGMLIFSQSPLSAVADEFNRYNRVKLVVADEKAERTRIGGSFQAANVASFIRLLRAGFGLHVRQQGDFVVISS